MCSQIVRSETLPWAEFVRMKVAHTGLKTWVSSSFVETQRGFR